MSKQGCLMKRRRDNTAKLAKALWSFESQTLDPKEFQSRFDAIYRAAEGPATLWQLGGAANDYLRGRPGSIEVPPELAPALLASTMVDGRIIGLKLLTRCSSDFSAICASIAQALESKHEGELYGGLYELRNLLERVAPSVALPVDDLLARLTKLRLLGDPYVRDSSELYCNWLTQRGVL
jgi:hypothetical protein